MNSVGSRLAGTVIVGVCWLAFILLFLAFLAGNFSFWQNVVISVVSIIVAGGIVAVMWIKWALR
ncbi:hypothetical protein KAU30_04000 [Candidatus Bathyarchaeota archaeon]|nr:hypothetical protein [Candidatus Bathyarchaeota archaeon]